MKVRATSLADFPSLMSRLASFRCSRFIFLGRPKRTPRFLRVGATGSGALPDQIAFELGLFRRRWS